MTSTVPEVPAVADTDVYITRAFDAPRERVWRFFTEPALLARWFGPASVAVDPESVVVDPEEGGRWHLDMVDLETGARYPLRARLTTVVPPEYLEGRVDGEQFGPEGGVTLRVWFHDHGAKTRITLHQGPFAPEARTATASGWDESFEKIDAIVAEGAA